ncbi:MAG: cation diffusion facilitator family transporter [Candidatus Aegiribacteria sp.]
MKSSSMNRVLKKTTRITAAALAANLFLSLSKLAGGFLAGSHALTADGVHSLSDSCTDIAIIVGARFWTRPSDSSHPHGHARIETLVSGFIGAFILVTGLYIGWQSFGSVVSPPDAPPGWTAFAVALMAIVIKGLLSRWTLSTARSLKSAALAANAMHQRSDVYSSIPVAIVVLAARLDDSLILLDGIGGVVVSLFVLKMGYGILRPALWQLSDTAAPKEIVEELRRIALSIQGVRDVHDLRTRYQGEGIQTDMHIVVDASMPMREAYEISRRVEEELRRSGPGVVDALVRLEPDG